MFYGARKVQRLIYDTFTGTNGTALTSHIPDVDKVGAGWKQETTPSSVVQIQNNTAKVVSNAGTNYPVKYIDSGNSNVDVRVSLLPITDGDIGVVTRWFGDRQYWMTRWYFTSAAVQIYENNSGYTLRASVAKTGGLQNYSISFLVSGNNLTATVGSTVLTHSSSLFSSSTKHGIWIPLTNSAADNFEVWSI